MVPGENAREAAAEVSIESRTSVSSHIREHMQKAIGHTSAAFGRVLKPQTRNPKLHLRTAEEIDNGQDVIPEKTYVCSICGNTIAGRLPEECPICGAAKEEFDVAQ